MPDRAKSLLVVIAFVACLLPFLGKPLHIDDPMFVWAAQNIVAHPLDFYGFSVNWHGTLTPMATVMKNPPLVSYYLAAFGGVFGWSEQALHAALIVPAAGLVLGTYRLAGEFTGRASDAALAAAFSPVLFLSSTTVMSDIPMLCIWVWSLLAWMKGIRRNVPALLAAGALGAGTAALTKYFGVALIPLFVLHGALRERRAWRWAPWLLIPAAMLTGYQLYTSGLYGRGLLLDATAYATAVRARNQWDALPKLGIGLAFTGGCLGSALWYAPALWSRRGLAIGAAIAAVVLGVLAMAGSIGGHALRDAPHTDWLQIAQLALYAALGCGVVALALADLFAERTPDSALLAAWVAGTLFFAIALNWSVSGRAILPAAPAFGILVARRLERRTSVDAAWTLRWARWAPVLGAVSALLVSFADQRLAEASRAAAERLSREWRGKARVLWFQGHWGFQYYAQLLGMLPLDYRHPAVEVGDVIIKPQGITNPIALPDGAVVPLGSLDLEMPLPVSTMSLPNGAGFYSDVWGPLPFAFGTVPPERYRLFGAVVPLKEP